MKVVKSNTFYNLNQDIAKKYKESEKGITLVALIVTVIILIILAAVTIFYIQDNKFIETAMNGTINYANAQTQEIEIVNDISDMLDEAIEKIEASQGKTETAEEILNKYTIEEIINNNKLLETILKNPTSESINKFTSSKDAMTMLGQNTLAKQEIVDSDEWSKAIANSPYRSDFSPYIVYNANSLCCTGGGRNYLKKYDGFALSVIYYVNGSRVLFVSKDKEAVLGYCTYNSSYAYEPRTLEFNNETWYYSNLPFGWTDGTGFNGIYLGKNIGKVNMDGWDGMKIAAEYALNDFFNGQ